MTFPPAGTPRDLVARINAELVRVFKLPEVADKLKALGLAPWISTAEELARYPAAEIVKWAKVVKDSGARAELTPEGRRVAETLRRAHPRWLKPLPPARPPAGNTGVPAR